jgi:hypothetical protein
LAHFVTELLHDLPSIEVDAAALALPIKARRWTAERDAANEPKGANP